MSDQPYEPDTTPALEILGASPLFGRLDRGTRAELADDLEIVSLAAGEQLFQQGDPGDSLYIVERGVLEVRTRNEAGALKVLDRLDAGSAVGEMALLTGQPRTAEVVAVVESRLLRVAKTGFDRLAAKNPAIASGFALSIVPRIQRMKLADIFGRLFGDIDPLTLYTIQDRVIWRRLAAGDVLFRQGEVGASMFVVVSGRLQIVVEGGDKQGERIIGEIRGGETVGEFALLTDDVRSATIYASRDTDIVEITRPVFEELIREYPRAMVEIARLIVMRQKRSIRVIPGDAHGAQTIAIIPAGREGLALHDFANHLRDSLSAFGPTVVFTSAQFDAEYGKTGAAQTELDDALSIVINGWLQEQEQRHQHILYVADNDWSVWTQRCLSQADSILLFGRANDDPALNAVETYCNPRIRKELVLLHEAGTDRPSGTLAWLSPRDVAAHHHLRLGDSAHWERLARRLTGRAVGAVFGGGAARGLAHIGIIRAFDDSGLPVDYIGGASMGAFISGGWAAGLTPADGMKLAEKMANPSYLLDRTFPYTSVMASKKVTAVIQEIMGGYEIEDLWRPFFCVSTNLSLAEPVLHERGPLWRAVRASIALPGIFSPVLNENNEMLTDGGVMNNFPLDIMASRAEFDLIIGCNVSPQREKPSPYELGESLSGWKVLWHRINPLSKKMNVPTLAETMLRTVEVNSLYHRKEAVRYADILIEPDTRNFNFLDFAAYRELEQKGYEAGMAAINAWRQKNP